MGLEALEEAGMPAALQAVLLLMVSNSFMTYAWYGHLRDLAHVPWYLVALIAWGVAFFEYQFQVPANRIGFTVLSLPQLKILQEAVSLLVFIPFSVLYMRAPLGADYFWASLCILGAVFFIFRSSWLGVPG
jgi:uncharacterized protein (DUF486 family)